MSKYEPRLYKLYKEEIAPKLNKDFNYKNSMSIPKLLKVIVNMSTGEIINDIKVLDRVVDDLSVITGRKPAICKAKKSIAAFKVREGMTLGARVTLRKTAMYEFLDRLINVALPRVKDFRGVSDKAFDKRGNYSLGIKEQIIFPEINYDKIDKIRGMNIAIVTTAKTDKEAMALLKYLGVPFRRQK